MASPSPFTIKLWSKAMTFEGFLGDPVAVAGSIRHNSLGNFTLSVRADDPTLQMMLVPGMRATIDYLGQRIISGKLRSPSGVVQPGGVTTFQLQDDWRKLRNTLAWVKPPHPIKPSILTALNVPEYLAQATYPGGGSDVVGPDGSVVNQYPYYLWPDGSAAAGGDFVEFAESCVKYIVYVNAGVRLGQPIVRAPDLSRGGNARAAGVLPLVRFGTLEEAVMPLLDWSGLGLQMMQTPADESHITVEVYEPNEWPAILTYESQIVQGGTWSTTDPTATRAVVGGPGDLAARAFELIAEQGVMEDEYGDIIEVFTDATSAGLKWGATTAALQNPKYFHLRPEPASIDKTAFASYMTGAGRTAVAKGAPAAKVSVTLGETESFRFGGPNGIQLGDKVRIAVPQLPDPIEARVSEVQFSFTANAGLKVTPIVGTATADPVQMLAQAVAALGAAQRRLSSAK